MRHGFAIIFTLLGQLAPAPGVRWGLASSTNAKKNRRRRNRFLSSAAYNRNSNFGAALAKVLYVDGQIVGATAPMTYFYREVSPGQHTLSTQSEFSNNDLIIMTDQGINYFVRQYIKFGVFVGGSNLELVSEEDGKKGVSECNLAK
jgi:hypothetical protein